MKLTKFEHACFSVEQDGKSLIVDPGDYTTDFTMPENVVAVVITHEHADHLSKKYIADIAKQFPDVVFIGHADITSQLGDYKTQSVAANEHTTVGDFDLSFFGGTHAIIHPDIPVIANLGVMINDILYYPGDSFTLPNQPVVMLALPVAAPWMKLSEAADFVRAVQPARIFPTHDAVLSSDGKGLPDKLIPMLTHNTGAVYERIKEPIEL